MSLIVTNDVESHRKCVHLEVSLVDISVSAHHQGRDTLSYTALDLLTSGSGCLSRLCSMRSAAWPQTLLLAQEAALLRFVLVLRNDSNVCKKAQSPVLHHHRRVFVLTGGGRFDYEAKWGEKQTHTGPSRHIFHAKKRCR